MVRPYFELSKDSMQCLKAEANSQGKSVRLYLAELVMIGHQHKSSQLGYSQNDSLVSDESISL